MIGGSVLVSLRGGASGGCARSLLELQSINWVRKASDFQIGKGFNIQLASSGPYGPLLARSGCLGKFVQRVGLMGWVNTRPLVCGTPYGMASGGQEEPFSRLALTV